jgi:hypothetical protein
MKLCRTNKTMDTEGRFMVPGVCGMGQEVGGGDGEWLLMDMDFLFGDGENGLELVGSDGFTTL